MARRKSRKSEEGRHVQNIFNGIHPDIKKTVFGIVLIGIAIVLFLASIGQAGPLGSKFYSGFHKLFGIGYYLLPAILVIIAFSVMLKDEWCLLSVAFIGGVVFMFSGLGFIDIVAPGKAGLVGAVIAVIQKPLGVPASIVILASVLFASLIVVLNRPFKFSNLIKFINHERHSTREETDDEENFADNASQEETKESQKKEKSSLFANSKSIKQQELKESEITEPQDFPKSRLSSEKLLLVRNYIAPPTSLLISSVEKPTVGDLRANANIIKRTLESFGIPVEMGEINVGPAVTRYTLKPAEGVKISRITVLSQDLALALASHPIRIEAPIPGKSLVGIEAPNKSAALVRVGSLILYPEFHKGGGNLSFALGRNVQGEPVFADISKMPHLLIAGATGSGKSISIHSLLISLLYKNSPETLKLILIDPKKVELSVYDDIPHLMSPVITDNKKAISVLRWAIQEMERRYQILLEAGCRDVCGYNKKKDIGQVPYLLIVIDELADLMSSYGREVEGSVIRLAQMARATGIHLVVSTQRPSVEVITGLIKANITSRIALQVASQIDSRTILDMSGAEKLLGHGDLLFISTEFSKPKRIQGSYITEEEIKKVVQFIKKNNPVSEQEEEESEELTEEVEFLGENKEWNNSKKINFDDFSNDSLADDELYEQAVETVRIAKKASASLLQRRLRVGYARAARLIDMMEEKGVVGHGEGAKPREVL